MKRLAILIAVVVGLALASVALAANVLSGTYKTKIHTTALGGQVNGTWTIKFKSGSYTVNGPGTHIVAKYSIQANKITFNQSGSGCHKPGTYKFKLAGRTLKFTKVSDSSSSCVGRQTILKGTFTKLG